jgi:hypothetical protein
MKPKRLPKRLLPSHERPRPLDLRRDAQRQMIARLLMMGWGIERIARKLHVTSRAVRYHISTPDFETLFTRLQREHLARVDRQMNALLPGAVDTLEKLLKHPDWKARDAAISHILRIHGKYLDRIDLTGQLDHTGSVRHVQAELVDETPWTDEMRTKARELLALQRQMLQRQLPAKFAHHDPHHDRDHHPVNGRFTSTNDQSDEERA